MTGVEVKCFPLLKEVIKKMWLLWSSLELKLGNQRLLIYLPVLGMDSLPTIHWQWELCWRPRLEIVSSVTQSCLTLWFQGLQYTRPPCPLPAPRVYSNACPLSLWCHLTIILSQPLLLPSIFPSIRVFSNELVLHIRWPKYCNFSFSISPSNVYSWLISFRMDWLDLLAVQETLRSLLQHHSSKASILHCSAFFIAQFSHPYMTTG